MAKQHFKKFNYVCAYRVCFLWRGKRERDFFDTFEVIMKLTFCFLQLFNIFFRLIKKLIDSCIIDKLISWWAILIRLLHFIKYNKRLLEKILNVKISSQTLVVLSQSPHEGFVVIGSLRLPWKQDLWYHSTSAYSKPFQHSFERSLDGKCQMSTVDDSNHTIRRLSMSFAMISFVRYYQFHIKQSGLFEVGKRTRTNILLHLITFSTVSLVDDSASCSWWQKNYSQRRISWSNLQVVSFVLVLFQLTQAGLVWRRRRSLRGSLSRFDQTTFALALHRSV